MKKAALLFLTLFLSPFYYSQNILSFHFLFGKEKLLLENKEYVLEPENHLQIQSLKFYISEIEFYLDEKIVWKEKITFHLVDASKEESLSIAISKPEQLKYTKIKFNLGVDSLTNVSGVMGGDLDPTKDMYWTWQSGYINFKLEGKSSLSTQAKKEFQFHLGGYKEPYNTFRKIVVETKKTEVVFDLKKFMDHLDLSKKDHLMLPGNEAYTLSEILADCFIHIEP